MNEDALFETTAIIDIDEQIRKQEELLNTIKMEPILEKTIIDEEPEVDQGEFSLVNAFDAKNSDGSTKLVQSFANTGEWAWKNPADNSLSQLRGEVIFDHVTFG